MKSSKPQIIETLLANSPSLCAVRKELIRQDTLLKHFQAVLPSAVAPHLLSARLRDGELVLYAESAAWLTRLRYQANQLVTTLPPSYPTPRKVRFRLVEANRQRTSTKPLRLSSAAAHAITASAEAIDDKPLRQAMLNLAAQVKT